MDFVAPTRAAVRFRCQPATATRLTGLGLEGLESDGGLVVEFPCSVDSDLFVEAAARSDSKWVDEVLVCDLSDGAFALSDPNPSGREWHDYEGVPAVWPKPELFKQPLTRLRLPSGATLDDLPARLVRWMQQVPELDPDALPGALRVWGDRLRELEALADARAASVSHLANEDERRQLRVHLSEIRRVLRWGTDSENDVALTPFTKTAYIESVETIANREVSRIYKLADRLEARPEEERQRALVEENIAALVREHLTSLSDRMKMIVEAEMLSQSTGVARSELLTLLRPGWDWDRGPLKEAVNPPEDAVRALLKARSTVDPNIRLAYRPTGRGEGRYVLVGEFLGRSIVGELDNVDSEARLANT